jgi:hypothetical protein
MPLFENVLVAIVVGGLAGLLTACLVPLARRSAPRLGALDEPGERKLHSSIMPRTGGLAIYGGFIATVGVGYFLLPNLRDVAWLRPLFGSALDIARDARSVEGKLVALLLGATLAFATGLADDIMGRRFPVAGLASCRRSGSTGSQRSCGSSASRTRSICSTTWTACQRASPSSPRACCCSTPGRWVSS